MATINGTPGDDALTGTSPDFLGNGGSDTINGLDGNDLIDGRGGSDTLNGGNGDDRFRFSYVGAPGSQNNARFTIDGGTGSNVIDLSALTTAISVSGFQQKFVNGVPAAATYHLGLTLASDGSQANGDAVNIQKIILGSGNDRIDVAAYNNLLDIDGGPGNDQIQGAGAGATVHGGTGDDSITAQPGFTYGDDGNDTILLGFGGALADGGAGTDTLIAVGGTGTVVDLAAHTASFAGSSSTSSVYAFENVAVSGDNPTGLTTVYGDDGPNVLISRTNSSLVYSSPFAFYGRGGNDTLIGGAAGDTLDGGDGDDTLDPGGSNNILIGGAGTDTAVIPFAFANATVSYGDGYTDVSGKDSSGSTVTERVSSVEIYRFTDRTIQTADGRLPVSGGNGTPTPMPTIVGTSGDDMLNGTSPDFLGNGGFDYISGLAGNDVIDGRGGTDTLDGGDGDDVFRFTVLGTPGSGTGSRFTILGGSGYDTVDFGAATTSVVVYPSSVVGQYYYLNFVSPDSANLPRGTARDVERLITGSGDDVINLNGYGTGPVRIDAGAGNDDVTGTSLSEIHGGAGNDHIVVASAPVYGDDGDDRFDLPVVGGATVDGGQGSDTARIYDLLDGTVDLSRGLYTSRFNGAQYMFSLVSVENVSVRSTGAVGGQLMITGDDGPNTLAAEGPELNRGLTLFGLGGDDTLFGAGGADYLDGGAGNDLLYAGGSNNIIVGNSGIDTVILPFSFEASTITFNGPHVDIAGPTGVNQIYSTERFQFGARLIDQADGNPLVDDLYYLNRYRDVAATGANVDADADYAATGWRQGRDPNALFDTSAYLGANRDVAAAGLDPLLHYDTNGWHEGRDPSVSFDSEEYLARNPDVKASGMDPLAHYLQFGRDEGRAIYAAVGSNLVGDFDPEYYLLANEDVAASGSDARSHYDSYGWHEGRDPDAYFDTSYYLANNPDVAAAGVNPLEHYETYGWREGRNPSALFDTRAYLAANPDVAAAGIDPLEHYLTYGRLEGRSNILVGGSARPAALFVEAIASFGTDDGMLPTATNAAAFADQSSYFLASPNLS